MTIRKISFKSDREIIDEYNKQARFVLTPPLSDTTDLEDYFGTPSIKGFAIGVLEDNKLVASIQCTTAGYLVTCGEPLFMHLTNRDIVFSVETLPTHRNRGYASKLLQSAFELEPNSTFVGIIAHDDITNMKLKSFYSRMGFNVSRYEDGIVET